MYLTWKVFSIARRIYDRKPTDDLKYLDVNTAIWCIFMSVTLQAAVHLGRDYLLNLRSVKNQSSKSVEKLIQAIDKLIKEQTEITGLSTITIPTEVISNDFGINQQIQIRFLSLRIFF